MLPWAQAVCGILLGVACGQTTADAQSAPRATETLAARGAPTAPPRSQSAPATTVTPPPRSRVAERPPMLEPGTMAGLVEFAKEWDGGGTLWMGALPGNGGRDVVIFVPPGWNADGRVQLVFHFHGTHSQQIAKQQPGMRKRAWVGHRRLTQTMEAMVQLQSERAGNVALVYPISAGKRAEPGWRGWFNKEYDRMWMSPAPGFTDDFEQLHQQATAALVDDLGVHPQLIESQAIAEGHSAGGIALRNLAEHGTTHVGEYIFLDASFQSWADRCWAAVVKHKTGARVTLVLTDGGMADPYGKRDPWCERLPVDAAAWPASEAWCAGAAKRKKQKPPGQSATCAALETAAAEWPEYQAWCEALADDFRDIEGLSVVRTKVTHGEQPRRFSGGLGLPVATSRSD